MLKKILNFVPAAMLLLVPAFASAHVIVTPNTADVGQELTFNVSVPNEENTPVTNLKLDIPTGVQDVTPTVKPGWTITPATNGDAKDPAVTSLTWSGGTIPVGTRDDFSFQAQVPASATELDWRAYQTYGDGTVVHWDQKPAGSDDATGNAGPYSVTKVINDLSASTADATPASGNNDTLPIVLSVVAILISFGSVLFVKYFKK